jgi:hypothetical protein
MWMFGHALFSIATGPPIATGATARKAAALDVNFIVGRESSPVGYSESGVLLDWEDDCPSADDSPAALYAFWFMLSAF